MSLVAPKFSKFWGFSSIKYDCFASSSHKSDTQNQKKEKKINKKTVHIFLEKNLDVETF